MESELIEWVYVPLALAVRRGEWLPVDAVRLVPVDESASVLELRRRRRRWSLPPLRRRRVRADRGALYDRGRERR